MTSLHFAHITDVHLSEGNPWGTLGAEASSIFHETLKALNSLPGLDAVLLNGDLLDSATPGELAMVRRELAALAIPWHFVPGNHDGFIDPAHPDALRPEEVVAGLDPRMAAAAAAGKAHWSRPLKPGYHLIGLDSRVASDWCGEIDAAGMAWLEGELARLDSPFIVLMIHHPLHEIGEHNRSEPWDKFVLSRGPDLEALLDGFPSVKLVLSGHHHVQQIVRRKGRLHLATGALTGYPCVYRRVQIDPENGAWRIRVQTHNAASAQVREIARGASMASTLMQTFPGGIEAWTALCAGGAADQDYEGLLE